MGIGWPWSRQRAVLCPDGTTQFVFKNVDHAFPFFFKQAKASAAAAFNSLKQLSGKIEAKYEADIRHILVNIDEKNGSVQAHLRAAYVLYSAAPCKKLDYLQSAIEEIRHDERDLRAAELAIRELVPLLSNKKLADDPVVTANIGQHIGYVLAALNRHTPGAILAEQMRRVEHNAQEWRAR